MYSIHYIIEIGVMNRVCKKYNHLWTVKNHFETIHDAPKLCNVLLLHTLIQVVL